MGCVLLTGRENIAQTTSQQQCGNTSTKTAGELHAVDCSEGLVQVDNYIFFHPLPLNSGCLQHLLTQLACMCESGFGGKVQDQLNTQFYFS